MEVLVYAAGSDEVRAKTLSIIYPIGVLTLFLMCTDAEFDSITEYTVLVVSWSTLVKSIYETIFSARPLMYSDY